MTNNSDDLVRHITNARSMLSEGSERSFVADTLQGLLDRIEQLEREKERKDKALKVCQKFACDMDTEVDTLARALDAILKGESAFAYQDAITIAERRVKESE